MDERAVVADDRWSRHRRRLVVAVLLAAVVLIAATVALWPRPTEEVRITSVDAFGMCAAPVEGGEQSCWRFGPELAKEAGWVVGECAQVRYGYRFVETPHVLRHACP